MIKDILKKLKDKKDLQSEEMQHAVESIMTGEVEDKDIEIFLIALNEKGVKEPEITAAASQKPRIAVARCSMLTTKVERKGRGQVLRPYHHHLPLCDTSERRAYNQPSCGIIGKIAHNTAPQAHL